MNDEELDDFFEDDDSCPMIETVLSAIFISRPLGFIWDEDIIIDFLKAKGYKIIERVDEDGESYVVPVKPDSKYIPEAKNMLRKVFDREIQKTLLTWLLKQ